MDNPHKRYKDYLNFRQKYSKYWGDKGDWKKGEIELVDDISLFPACEDGSTSIITSLGVGKEYARKQSLVGIRDENRWGVTVAEPVKTPSGNLGIFARFISWGQIREGKAGLVIVPVLLGGEFVFIKTFRNASRSWCLEFPRGTKDKGIKIINLIVEELSFEIGAKVVGRPIKIGQIEPDDGSMSAVVDVYKAVIKITENIKPETMEAIKGVVILNKDKIKKILKTQMYKDKDGKEYSFKDGFTLSSLQLLGV